MSESIDNEKQLNLVEKVNKGTQELLQKLSGNDKTDSKKLIDNIIAFLGVAGGTGTSTLVANVAAKLSEMKLSVVIIDMSIDYPSQHIYYSTKVQDSSKDYVSFLNGRCRLGDSLIYFKEIGVIYSINRNFTDYINCDVEITARNFKEALDKLSGLYDVVIIDAPLRIDNIIVNTGLSIANAIYAVWDESVQCVSNYDRIRQNMELIGIDSSKMKSILNKRTSIHYPKSVFNRLGVELIQVLPFDIAVIESGLLGEVFCKKGESLSSNSKAFNKGISELTTDICKNGGYNIGQ